MKRFLIFTMLIFVSAASVEAQSNSKKKQIERLAAKVADTPDLSVLDRARLIRGSVKIVIEYSIYDIEQDPFEVRRFRSFKNAER